MTLVGRRVLLGLVMLGGLAPVLVATARAAWWQPEPGLSWQYQLNKRPAISREIDVYDVDLWFTTTDQIDELHDRGSHVVCYFSAGSRENWRPDAGAFPDAAVGKKVKAWKGERWLDVRSPAVRAIMEDRLDLAREKGCDAVDPDWLHSYLQDTGFPLTADDQLDYNRFLASEAHERGLAIGLKNDIEQTAELVDAFDFNVNEQCFEYHECGLLQPFVDAGKPVFQVEYGGHQLARKVCPKARERGFETLIKKLKLDEWRIACDGR